MRYDVYYKNETDEIALACQIVLFTDRGLEYCWQYEFKDRVVRTTVRPEILSMILIGDFHLPWDDYYRRAINGLDSDKRHQNRPYSV